MSTDIITTPFEQIIEGLEIEPACECCWHRSERGPAVWVVHMKPWCCFTGRARLWCDDCLQEVMNFDGDGLICDKCGQLHPGANPKHQIASIEPLKPGAE